MDLEGIIFAYRRGCTPEEIQASFDTVSLDDAHSVIGYYLHRKEEVEEYLVDYERRWDEAVTGLMAQPGTREFYDRVKAFRRQKESAER